MENGSQTSRDERELRRARSESVRVQEHEEAEEGGRLVLSRRSEVKSED